MLILSRRFAALAAMLALCTGNLAVCAGWKATPEARMACCTDDTTCPMHKSASHRSGSRRVVTQEQADSCCATSARNHTATTASDVVLFSTLTLAPSPVPVTLPILDFALAGRRSLVALPRASVPTHLLLSVFLV